MKIWYRLAIITVLASALVACRSSQPESASNSSAGTNGSRYSIKQDRAPTRGELDLSQVREVIPVPLNRGRAGNGSPYTVLGKSYTVMPTEIGYNERGVASWYGEKFHGHKTSNGEIFDMYQISAAHKSLPIPSFLNVTNLDNNRSLVVRVNDRGPFHGDRVIDLSYAAAVLLGYADKGTARVQLEAIVPTGSALDRGISRESERSIGNGISRSELPVVTRRASNGSEGQVLDSYLQVGAFSEIDSARNLADKLRGLTDKPVFIRSVNADGRRLHRVRIGPLNNPSEAARISAGVVAANLGKPYTVAE